MKDRKWKYIVKIYIFAYMIILKSAAGYFPVYAVENAQNLQGSLIYNGHSYALYDKNDFDIENYSDMAEFCEKLGGHLAVINSAEENQAIYQYVLEQGLTMAFFGYSDEMQEGVWKWITDDDNTYTNWAEGQPNNGANNKKKKAENYAHFAADGNGTWNDAPFGSNTSHFVCEWEQVKNIDDRTNMSDINISEVNTHRYAYYYANGTWKDAFDFCLSQNGHLLQINDQAEMDYVIQQLETNGLRGTRFYIGARRELDSSEYYWVDTDNKLYGTPVNNMNGWWLSGEPSLYGADKGIHPTEYVVGLSYEENGNRWGLTDLSDNLSEYIGNQTSTVGFICEFEK